MTCGQQERRPESRAGHRSQCALAIACLSAWLCSCASGTERSSSSVDGQAQNVRRLIDDGRFIEAETAAQELLPRFAAFPSDLGAGDLIVEALLRNGRGAEPRTYQIANRVVQARIAQLGPADVSLSRSYRNLGDVLFQAGDYRLATIRFKKALAIREWASNTRPSDVADDLDRLVRVLTETDAFDKAYPLSDRALSIRARRGDSGDDLGLASTLQARALLEQRRGNYEKARAALERTVVLRETANPSHPDTARALMQLGVQRAIDGDLIRSREVLTRALNLARVALRTDHPEIASYLAKLAATLQEMGDLAESRLLRQRAVDIAEKAFGPEHALVAPYLNDLANTHYLQGEYSAATALYERARGIYQRRYGRDHLEAITASFNLALTQSELGDLQEARSELQEVIRTWERVLGPEHPSVARALSVLAGVLLKQGLDDEARKYYERTLAIRERMLGPNHPYVATTLSRLAAISARLGDMPRAAELSGRALRISEMSGSQFGLANALLTHGQVLLKGGDAMSAGRAYQRALDIQLPLLGSSHPRIADTEVAYSVVQARLNHRQEAFERALRADEISRVHAQLTLTSLSERQALDYAATRPHGLDVALSLMSTAEEKTRALDAIVLGRSLTLDEIASRHHAFADSTGGTLLPLWSAMAAARQRLANLVVKGPNDQHPEQYKALVDQARKEKEQAEGALGERNAAFRSQMAKTKIGIQAVSAALPPDSALVSFVRFDRTIVERRSGQTVPAPPSGAPKTVPSYAAFVLRPGLVDPEVVSLGPAAALEALISRWRRDMVAGITAPSAAALETEREFRKVGTSLRESLWDPVAGRLNGVSRVFVVPDDAINLVPLSALPIGQSQYMVDGGPVIHYLSAERDLVTSGKSSRTRGRGLLAIGGPAFTDGTAFAALTRSPGQLRVDTLMKTKPGELVASTAAIDSSAPFRSAGSACPTFQSMQFGPLPASRREAEEIAELWRTSKSPDSRDTAEWRLLTGRDATERAIKQLGPGKRLLHFATHGYFLADACATPLSGSRSVGGLAGSDSRDPGSAQTGLRRGPPENPLLFSFLALAGANQHAAAGPDEEDGILTAEEVASLNLEGVEWAVLSACNTGLGEIQAGEGVMGLRRAFQIAGARTVIMSLWPVDDQATRSWMRALYDGRLNRQLSTADAVRDASLSTLRERRAAGKSTHPFYWAAFVAAGDWH
jgi:CHAT domain-containing protein/tetratricopeptide (TPR) repeat protein